MKKFKVGIILFIMLLEVGGIFLMTKGTTSKNLNEKEIKKEPIYAVLLETGYNTKTYTKSNTWPTSGYTFDATRSGCVDKNGKEVDTVINYKNNLATLNDVKESVKCYMYFSKN